VQDVKTCDDKKAIAFIDCAYLVHTEAPFAPPAQKSDALKLASLQNFAWNSPVTGASQAVSVLVLCCIRNLRQPESEKHEINRKVAK